MSYTPAPRETVRTEEIPIGDDTVVVTEMRVVFATQFGWHLKSNPNCGGCTGIGQVYVQFSDYKQRIMRGNPWLHYIKSLGGLQ